jgi:hypothetical protein
MRRVFVVGAVLCAAAAVRASPAQIVDVASSFDKHNKFDFRFRVHYTHTEKQATIKRELQGLPGQDATEVRKDLIYRMQRETLAFRAEVGLFRDLMLHVELPLIIEESAVYRYDQQLGGNCVYPTSGGPDATCVNETNSTTVRDGLVPVGGYDAGNGGGATMAPDVFRSVVRGARGGGGLDAFDTLNLGLTWAPVSQARDDTKPTWIIAFDAHVSIGTIKAFNRADPAGNYGVSEGVHRLYFRTAVSRRLRFVEPYFSLWYMAPVARSDSLFVNYGRAQKTKDPQMQAGVLAGAEFVPWERPEKQYKFVIDLRARFEGHFHGRAYSEMWELLAAAPGLACDATTAPFNPACDSSATQNPYQGAAFTGLTTVENYPTVGAELALAGQIGPYFRIRSGFRYSHDRPHLISGDDKGTPMNPTGRVTTPAEFNPAYRPVIDQVGRRYRTEGAHLFDFFLWAQVMF